MIRDFKSQDIDEIMQIWLETNISAHSFINPDYWKSNFKMVKEMMPNATIYVYEDTGVIKGFIGLIDGFIAGIFVAADSQSNGIGKQLLDFAKAENSNLSLSVYKRNTRAINFYLRESFNIMNEKEDEITHEAEFNMQWTRAE